MPLKIVVTTNRWKNDPSSREMVDYLEREQRRLNIENGILYYDFPSYADYEAAVFRPDLLLFSPSHGFIAVRFIGTAIFQRSNENILEIDQNLEDFCSNLHSKLIKSRLLRKGRVQTIVEIHPVIFNSDAQSLNASNLPEIEAEYFDNMQSFSEFISKIQVEPLDVKIVDEVRSVVEGAKALSRPQKRIVSDPVKQPLAAAMANIENEIANFDERQRNIALVDVGGPARIRGLAGSGKTVILAMKAAHIHLTSPDDKVLFTFHTKSLRATIKTLITKFYRLYSDTDPNWKNIHIRHSWGGAYVPGVYSEACSRSGQRPMTLPEAKRLAKSSETALGAICSRLLESGKVKPYYDHVLIDEGQDLPASFYRLALTLTKGKVDKQSIVWAYDELQDIMNVKIRQPDELFGRDNRGRALVDLDRSSRYVPPGGTNDAVLERAYRNQRDVLVCAHALGFGVYGEIVQMLESREHWEDVGYTVNSGDLVIGENVVVERPSINSPLTIPTIRDFPLISHYVAPSFSQEIEWVVSEVRRFVDAGLQPEEILVICLDDRNAKNYLSSISNALAKAEISSNNIIADPYNEPPFTISQKVTLSTVYRAKGNETAAVFAVGVDGVQTQSRDGRNRIFTAFTRSKAWLRVSGLGHSAENVIAELEKAKTMSPRMEFEMPDPSVIDTIQRGFSRKQAAAKAARAAYITELRNAGLTDEEIENELHVGVPNVEGS